MGRGALVLITGTDTGVGKSWVGCEISRTLRSRGIDVRGIKLVESGTEVDPAPTEDGVMLAVAAGQHAPTTALRRYRAPVTPAAAAEREGAIFDLDRVLDETREIAAGAEITIVEGAGGLLAPLTWDRSLRDVAQTLHAEVIVVAADRLGTINHTLLTLDALAAAGIPCLALVMNRVDVDPTDASIGTNAAALRRVRPALQVYETADPRWLEGMVGMLRELRVGWSP